MTDYRLIAGIVLAVAIAIVAHYRKALSTTGAVAAVLVAAACVAAGWSRAIILIAFFIGGTLLSRIGGQTKRTVTGDIVEKSGARDAWQVFANGGPFAIAAIGSLIWPSNVWQILGAGAIAASSADTWATEIGTLSSHSPRSIVGWRPVATGTSGGVTWLGMCASFGGAAFIAVVAFLLGWNRGAVCAAIVGGFGGSLVDSLLGASLQVRRRCPRCEKATERTVHACGTTTDIVGGLSWMDNDAVNFLSSTAGALIGGVCLL